MEVISRDRGTTFADGASRGAPQALQIADRWHLIHNLDEALEKVRARHHADLKPAFLREGEPRSSHSTKPEVLIPAKNPSQAEQARRVRQERRLAIFNHVQELSAQGWSVASIACMLGIHKKTAAKICSFCLQGKKAAPMRSPLKLSCHLVRMAKARRSLIGRAAPARSLRTSASSGKGSM